MEPDRVKRSIKYYIIVLIWAGDQFNHETVAKKPIFHSLINSLFSLSMTSDYLEITSAIYSSIIYYAYRYNPPSLTYLGHISLLYQKKLNIGRKIIAMCSRSVHPVSNVYTSDAWTIMGKIQSQPEDIRNKNILLFKTVFNVVTWRSRRRRRRRYSRLMCIHRQRVVHQNKSN